MVKVYEALCQNQATTAPELAEKSGLNAADIDKALKQLEIDGAVERFRDQHCMVTHTHRPTWWANKVAFNFMEPEYE